MGEQQAPVGLAQRGEAGVGEAAADGYCHAVAAQGDLHRAGAAPQLQRAVVLAQFFGGEVEEVGGRGRGEPGAGLLRGLVGERPVGGEHRVGRAGGADQLVGGDHPAQAAAAGEHVVPGQRGVGGLGGKTVEQEVGHQPRGLGRQVGGRVEAVVAEVGDHPGRHVQRHRADRAAGADAHGPLGAGAQDAHPLRVLAHVQRMAGELAASGHPGFEAAGQEGEAVRPGEQAAVGGVGGLAAAAGEVVQAGPGRHLVGRGAVFVAADVIQIGVQARRAVALGGQPGAEADAVEAAEGRVGAGLGQGHAEGAPAVAAAGVGEGVHPGQEAPVLGGLVGAHVGGGQQAVAPGAVEEQALVGGVYERRLAEAGAGAEGLGFDHAQLVQQLAHWCRFERRQRQVVGTAGEGEGGAGGAVEAPAGGVAEGLRAGEQQEVVVARLGQPPGRGEAGDAAAEDRHAGTDLALRGG